MIKYPNAKINIGLNITEKRPDGFHNIETVFYPIKLSDILEIKLAKEKFLFTATGSPINHGVNKKNICIQAFHLFQKYYSIHPVQIHLHKIIPTGAGLGGGSSDAAFTLSMLNSLTELNLTVNDLQSMAEKTGSDCPFFIINKPSYANEKGNILNSVEINLNGHFLVLIYPSIHINTAEAYKKITPQKSTEKLPDLIRLPIEDWKGKIKNDFEKVIFDQYPEIEKIKNQLYNSGALFASMSGSGSAVYGIFKNEINLSSLFNDYFIWSEWL